MTPAQQEALEKVAGRALTAPEVAQIDALLPIRNDVAIAAILSVGRKRLQHTRIGPGTICAVMGDDGGPFLDALQTIGANNRTVFWGAMGPIQRGEFDMGEAAAQAQVDKLILGMPQFAVGLRALQALAYTGDPLPFDAVSAALNQAEGRMML